MNLKVIRVGNSKGVILPKEVLARLRIDLGDNLSVVDTAEGVELRPADDDFEEQMAVAREVMRRRRLALRELAK
jgi:putative addiction module antidote